MIRLTMIAIMAFTMSAHEVEELGWLAGCWQGDAGPLKFEEQWMRPAGGLMLGMSRTIRDDKAVSQEFLSISAKSGAVYYTARVGTATTPFKLSRLTQFEAVFENPEHDFPQRIIYQKKNGSLHARIEGMEKGKSKSQDFPMRRATCP